MVISISPGVKAGMLDGITDEGIIPLLIITHPSWDDPIRLSIDKVDTLSRGNLYISKAFNFTLPDDLDGQPKSAQLVIEDIDRSITAKFRAATSAPKVVIELVNLKDPNVVEASFSALTIREPNWESPFPVISMRIIGGDSGEDRFPKSRFVPSLWPGLF